VENTRYRFHVRCPNSNGAVVANAGAIGRQDSRNDLDEVRDWASEPANLALLLEVWRRLDERA